MVCGRNYHDDAVGGKKVNGCGQGFNYSKAPMYVAAYKRAPEIKHFDLAPPGTNPLLIFSICLMLNASMFVRI